MKISTTQIHKAYRESVIDNKILITRVSTSKEKKESKPWFAVPLTRVIRRCDYSTGSGEIVENTKWQAVRNRNNNILNVNPDRSTNPILTLT